MKIVCPICQGTGIIFRVPKNLVVPKGNRQEMLERAEKALCDTCDGEGEVDSGFMARKLGLKKEVINEGGK